MTAIVSLDLRDIPLTGVIANTADGAGWLSMVDATAGGPTPTTSGVYARFTSSGLSAVRLSDVEALQSTGWDIALRRYVIRLNGGDSGPGCASAALTVNGTTYESVGSEPPGLTFLEDDFLGPSPTCSFMDDGSGLTTAPATAFSSPAGSYYTYTSCVAMTGRVFIVHTTTGATVKLTVTSYYQSESAQTSCNNTGSAGGSPGGYLRLRWQFL